MALNLSFAQEVSMALDLLGHNLSMIKWRRHCYNIFSDFVLQWTVKAPGSLHGLNFKPYLIGSKVEGTTVLYQSDEDYMVVCDCFVCASRCPRSGRQSADKVWVRMITENVDHGYTLLQRSWEKESVDKPGLQAFLQTFTIQHSDGREYISSEKLNRGILDAYNKLYEAAVQDGSISDELMNYIKVKPAEKQSEGSSYKLKVKNLRFTLDFVLAFPCVNLEFMSQWVNRERKHGWPRADSIWKIQRMCAYVVPKSSKKRHQRHLEFRICHTFGEIELMKSLNETQIKLYVLLKELFKSEFKSKHPDIITSYVLKNVMFWLCERTPAELFKLEHLMERLSEALRYIYDSVVHGVIPNYFIPERNLLDGLIIPETHNEISSTLSTLIAEGDNVVFRINNINRGLQYLRKNCITQTVLTIHFRNLGEIYYLNKRRYDLMNGAARLAVWYFSNAAYKFLERQYFVASPKF